jgi:hypothetical protein
VPQALVVETALASHLSPDGVDRLEAALDSATVADLKSVRRVKKREAVLLEPFARHDGDHVASCKRD